MKKTVLTLMLIFSLLTFSITAYADLGLFHFTLYSDAPSQGTASVRKSDNRTYAIDTVTSISYFDQDTDAVYMRVRDAAGINYASRHIQLTGKGTGTYHLPYYSPTYGNNGDYYRLFTNMHSTVSGGYVIIYGNWTP